MIAVGKQGIEAELGLADSTSCAPGQNCFVVGSPSRAMVGTNAGTFYGIRTGNSSRHRAGCYVFLHQDAAGWHYDNGRCITAVEQIPSAIDQVYTGSGCVNVRDTPSISGRVLWCLQAGTKVYLDSAPTYASGHIWWHLVCLGWMAHDFLVIPLGQTNHAAGNIADVPCQSPQPPYSPMISMSLDSGPLDSDLVAVASGFPPNEYSTAYWQNQYPGLLGTPGPVIDSQGHFEADTQDEGRGTGISFFVPNTLSTKPDGADQLCADTTSAQQQYAAKACAAFTVVTEALNTASPSPTSSAAQPPSSRVAPAASPVASVVAIQPYQIGVVVIALLLIAVSGVAWLRRRRL